MIVVITLKRLTNYLILPLFDKRLVSSEADRQSIQNFRETIDQLVLKFGKETAKSKIDKIIQDYDW